METLWKDLRYGLRMLAKSPGFAAVAVLTLALGIGANTAIFSVVNAVLLRPLPFPDSDRIVMVWELDPNREVTRGIASPAEFLDWRKQNHVFSHISAWRAWFYNLTGNGEPEQVLGIRASYDFFDVLGVHPALGRAFLPEEETPGRDQVVVISDGLWVGHFGADPRVIGQSILIDDKPVTIIGVLPRGFSLAGTSRDFGVWMPMSFDTAQLRRGDHTVLVSARLKPGVTMLQAQAEMAAIMHGLQEQYHVDEGLGVHLVRMQDDQNLKVRPALLVLLGAVALVLLIACVNVANLLLARGAARQRELSIRTALGARRTRLIRQLVTESMLLSLLGGALGLFVAFGGIRLLLFLLSATSTYGELPHHDRIHIDAATLLFAFAISIITGILFGLAPALQTSRTDISETLKESGRGSAGVHSNRMRSALVVSEVALALVLLIGAGLLIRSFRALLTMDLGFNPENVLTMQSWLPDSHYPGSDQVISFYHQSLERLRAVPGVTSASAINFLPLSGWGDITDFFIEGRPTPAPGHEYVGQYRVISPGYFQTMQIPLKQGRDFSETDTDGAPGVAIINETLAQRYWPNEDPIGKHIKINMLNSQGPWRPKIKDAWLTVVAIAGDVHDWELGENKVGQVYISYLQNPSRLMKFAIRSASDPASLVSGARQAILDVDKNQPVTDVKTMAQFLDLASAQHRTNMLLLGTFSALALVLAAVGIYGVMSYAVAQRVHEIGIRMALGAEPRDVLRLIIGQGLRLTFFGLIIGVAGSLAAGHWLASLLFGVKATDPLTYVAVALLLVGVAFLACYIPARRAMRVDPIIALRYE
ncbi:MAG TPA: ABC transporter permease [Candidatus Acidoferrales bacterium]|jgi:putative ABC transport system permease protein|nr:ABC transporter permease [Candidatus Acidoferrales bacterium]